MTTTYHWWIITQDDVGKPYLVYGSPRSEEEAQQKGMELLGGIDFRVRKLPTRDKNRASALLRGSRLEETHSLARATMHIGHEKSIKRLRRRCNTAPSWE